MIEEEDKMTAPQQYPGQPGQQQFQQPPAPQGWPGQQQQQYAPAPPQGYAPQQAWPQQQGYAQPYQQPGFPQSMEQPPPQLAKGTLDDFYSQPSAGGGAALKFEQVGQWHIGIVSRALTNGDIEQSIEMGSNKPAYFRDGRPKFVMKVPLNVPVTQTNTDGKAQWYCRGASRDELTRAMSAAGADGAPEPGSAIYVALTGTRPSGTGMTAKTYEVRYWRPAEARAIAQQYGIEYPDGTQSSAPAQPAPQVQAAPAQPAPVSVPQQQVTPAPPPAQVAPPQAPPPVQEQQPVQPPAQPAPPAPGTNELNAAQQQLLQTLTGGQG